jgi:hypothetical protein
MPNQIIWPKPYRMREDNAINIAPGIMNLVGFKKGEKLQIVIDQEKQEITLRKAKK